MSDSDLELIKRGAAEVISESDLKDRMNTGRPLVIKAGFDPTAPDLHLGHTVLLRKLRHFQDMGHKVIFLIGDATALIGDPSGQSKTRKVLTWEEVRENAATYQQQVKHLLLMGRKSFEVRYNSEWVFGASPQMRSTGLEVFDFRKFVELASRTTVARILERDDFSKRLSSGKPVSFLELFYPLLQAYDSVKIAEQHGSCDVEIGGTDQTFNLLMGRELLKAYGHQSQIVLTLPLLEGTDGEAKMSKSLNNHIGIQDPPQEMFGKVMSIPDSLIIKYFTLLTDVDVRWIEKTAKQIAEKAVNPRDIKLELAKVLVSMYHSSEAADEAYSEFLRVFSQKELPADMPEYTVTPDDEGKVNLIELLCDAGLASSKGEARRLIRQGAVKLNGSKMSDTTVAVDDAEGTLQVGPRKFLKLIK